MRLTTGFSLVSRLRIIGEIPPTLVCLYGVHNDNFNFYFFILKNEVPFYLGREGVALLFSLNLGALDAGGWSTRRPGRFYPGKDPVPIVQNAEWALETVWIGAENLTPTGIRSPDLPARSESLY